SVTSFRRTKVIDPDSIRYVYPDSVVDFHQEEINQTPSVIPASYGLHLGLRPFPGLVTRRSDLLWTANPEIITNPRQLLNVDNDTLVDPTDIQLELAHDLADIARNEDEMAYANWLQRIAEQLDARIPQGAVAEAFVKSIAWGGLGLAIKNRNKTPLVAA